MLYDSAVGKARRPIPTSNNVTGHDQGAGWSVMYASVPLGISGSQ